MTLISSDITLALAELIVTRTPSDDALNAARRGVIDFVASTLPVTQGAIADKGLVALKQVFHGNDSLSHSLRLGYAGHALDFDDFHPAFRGHPSTVILPALFALAAEIPTVSETDFLTAYVIGVEMAGRSGLASGPRHYAQGFHNTATLGTMAAAAAASRLANASVAQTQNSLGLAATQAAGLRAQFGTDAKPLHAGLAARSGLTAVKLALAGFAGSPRQVLEAFLATHGAGQQQAERWTADWGKPWRILSPGLEFKRFATCSGTHSAAEAALILRARWLAHYSASDRTLIEDIARITVSFPPGGDTAPFIRQATTGIEARFSLEYVIAAALVDGTLALPRFGPEPVDPALAALADRVTRIADPNAPPDELNPEARFHEVTLYLLDGEALTARVTRQESLAHPIDLDEKLRLNLAALPHLDSDKVLAHCRLHQPGDLRTLLPLLLS